MREVVCRLQDIAVSRLSFFPKNNFFSFSLVRYSGYGAVSVMKEQKRNVHKQKEVNRPGKFLEALPAEARVILRQDLLF